MDNDRAYWSGVYNDRPVDDVSWFQPTAARSLALIQRSRATTDAAVIDVGAGASVLVDDLLHAGFRDVTALDVAAESLAASKKRLGANADRVEWLDQDLLTWQPARRYDIWHDRAVFHFLTTAEERDRYRKVLHQALAPSGHVIIAAFAADGPQQCSGLLTARYTTQALAAQFPDLELLEELREEHHTPWGAAQPFSWVLLAARR